MTGIYFSFTRDIFHRFTFLGETKDQIFPQVHKPSTDNRLDRRFPGPPGIHGRHTHFDRLQREGGLTSAKPGRQTATVDSQFPLHNLATSNQYVANVPQPVLVTLYTPGGPVSSIRFGAVGKHQIVSFESSLL